MARKRTMATAMMTLPQALGHAVQNHLPAEILMQLTAQEALAVGAALEEAARAIARIIDNRGGRANG
jgi:hypothetical protein